LAANQDAGIPNGKNAAKAASLSKRCLPRWVKNLTHGTFTVSNDVTLYTKARIFSAVGKQTPLFVPTSAPTA
jgi:hypothetical protein